MGPSLENHVISRKPRQSYLENHVISRKLRQSEKVRSNRENAYNTFAEIRAMMLDVAGNIPCKKFYERRNFDKTNRTVEQKLGTICYRVRRPKTATPEGVDQQTRKHSDQPGCDETARSPESPGPLLRPGQLVD